MYEHDVEMNPPDLSFIAKTEQNKKHTHTLSLSIWIKTLFLCGLLRLPPLQGRVYQDKFWLAVFVLVTATYFLQGMYIQHNYNKHPGSWIPGSGTGWEKAWSIAQNDFDLIVGLTVASLAAGALWSSALRDHTRVIVWGTLGTGLCAMGLLGTYLLFDAITEGSKLSLFWSIVVLGAFLVSGLILRSLSSKIDLTIVVIQEANRAVQANKALIPMGLALVIAYAFFTTWSFDVVVGAYSTDDEHAVDGGFGMSFLVFGYFWITATGTALLHTTVAGTTAHWYFSRSAYGSQETGVPAFSAWKRAAGKSLGSIAAGSLIVATLQWIAWLIEQSRKAASNSGNQVLAVLISCIGCIVRVVERWVEMVNRFAYVYIAMYGSSFCESTGNVKRLLQRNVASVVLTDVIVDAVMMFGKFGAMSLISVASLMILDAQRGADEPSRVSAVTMALSAGIPYAVFSLYDKVIVGAVDAVLVCYMEDMERNSDSGDYFMTAETHTKLQSSIHNRERAQQRERIIGSVYPSV